MEHLRKFVIGAFALLAALTGCAPTGRDLPPLQVVPEVDLSRYAGTWYEIARFPHRFQRGCVATRAIYTLHEDGVIGVYNECRRETFDGPLSSVEGRARVADQGTPAKLEVSFFWPFWGAYWVIDLDPDYRWAVVGHPSRAYLWILCREPRLDPAVLDGIRSRLQAQGYDLAPLLMTPQP